MMESVQKFILSTVVLLLFFIIGTSGTHTKEMASHVAQPVPVSAYWPQETPLERTLQLLNANKVADVPNPAGPIALQTSFSHKILHVALSYVDAACRHFFQPDVSNAGLQHAHSCIGMENYLYMLRRILI